MTNIKLPTIDEKTAYFKMKNLLFE